MAKDPAFLFYSSDFLTGTAFMNFEDKGKYITILCQMHQHGRLNEESICFLVGSVSVNLKAKFRIDGGGFWYNERLELETEKRNKYTESRRNNGLMGGRGHKKEEKPIKPKPKKEKAHAKHMAHHMEDENENRNDNKDIDRNDHPLQVLISQDYPNVSKMKSQLTQSQAETIQAKYKPEEIKSVLDGMENHTGLVKKYMSVSLTIQGWLKRRQETGGNKQPANTYIPPIDHF